MVPPVLVIHFLPSFSHCSLCDRYDNIASRVYEDPDTTEDMVELVAFLSKVSTVNNIVWYWPVDPLLQPVLGFDSLINHPSDPSFVLLSSKYSRPLPQP